MVASVSDPDQKIGLATRQNVGAGGAAFLIGPLEPIVVSHPVRVKNKLALNSGASIVRSFDVMDCFLRILKLLGLHPLLSETLIPQEAQDQRERPKEPLQDGSEAHGSLGREKRA